MKKGRMPYPQSGRVHLIGQPEPQPQPQPILPRGLHRYLVAVAIERPGEFPTFESLIEERSMPLCEGAEIGELQRNTAKALAGDGPEPKVTVISISRMLFLDQEIVDKIEARKKAEADLLEAYLKDEHAEAMGHHSEYAFNEIPKERREVIRLAAAEIRAEREREAKERADGMPACAACDKPVTIAEAEAGAGLCPVCSVPAPQAAPVEEGQPA